MRSDFSPKQIQRAKETLHRQLEVVRKRHLSRQDKDTSHPKAHTSLWQRILHFFRK
jgi:predicted nucleic acid-binding protein